MFTFVELYEHDRLFTIYHMYIDTLALKATDKSFSIVCYLKNLLAWHLFLIPKTPTSVNIAIRSKF